MEPTPLDAKTLLANTVDRLRIHEGRYAEISRQFPDIGYSWLTKVAHGQIENPTVTSLQQLIEALDAFEAARAAYEESLAAAKPTPAAAEQ